MPEHTYPLEFLYDGNCAICRCDVAHLRRRDRHRRITFVDIAHPDFDPAIYGRSRDELLARMHARRADGVLVDGPEAFRLAFAALGCSWLIAPTRWPGLSHLTEFAYRWFARNRVRLSHRYAGVFARLTPRCDTDTCAR
jgi:predicted DCC family thiol-disulfide oxidoreductase YuxK